MTIRQPPRFAPRLLMRLVPAQNHDALLGDLSEEFQRRRSVTWYCLQILAAVIVGTLKDIRGHMLVAARAIATVLISQLLLTVTISTLRDLLTGAGFMWGNLWIGLPWYWHWPYASGLEMTLRAIWVGGDVMIGWLIVRLHRGHGLTMVLACCGGLGVLRFASVLQIAQVTGWSPHFRTLFYWAADGQIREWFLMITGGYVATRRREAA